MANTLYAPGESHARSLIRAGRVNETDAWEMSAEDENALLGDPPNWSRYGSWHLGRDTDATEDTKAEWKYPFGKDGEVYRAALRAAASRAGQQGDSAISEAASALLGEIDTEADKARAAAPRPWYRFAASADGPEVADLYVYDEIGSSFWTTGVTARQFVADLDKLADGVKTLRVHINSPGGDVFDAVAIANALRSQSRDKGRRVEMSIEGLAASAATIITSAGDVIRMADNALLMVHNPLGWVMGPAVTMREVAAVLDRVRDAIIATYRWVSALSAEQIGALMDATTWMNADEALANGFATEIIPSVPVQASIRPEALGRLGIIPEPYRALAERFTATAPADPPPAPAPPDPAPAPVAARPLDVLRACRDASVEILAERLIASNATLDEVRARVTAAKEIVGLCKTARLPEMVEGYLKADTPADVVKMQLTALTARIHGAEIDAHLADAAPQARGIKVLSIREIYSKRNALPEAPRGATT